MNLLNGFTGLFSLGHAGFMLIGAYTYAIFSIPMYQRDNVYRYYDYLHIVSFPEVLGNALGYPGVLMGMLISIIIAGLVAAAIAFLIGLPVLRFKSDYLAIATLGFAEIIRTIVQWRALGPLTNAANPLRMFTRIGDLFFYIGDFRVSIATFALVLVAGLCIVIISMLVRSSYGRAFKAIREDDIAAEAMGINLFKHKQLSFCISSFFVGVGGALFAIFNGTVVAGAFSAARTYEFLLIIVLGGIGSISGSVLAALLFVFASQWWLRGLDAGTFMGISLNLFRPGFRLVVFAVIIMCVVIFFRKGMMGDKELPYHVGIWKDRINTLFRKRKTIEEAGASDE
jgi:branched-chain amino acid transport system permease protein